MSKGELEALIDESLAYDEVLRKSGHYLVSEALQSVQTTTTIRVRNGKLSITDATLRREIIYHRACSRTPRTVSPPAAVVPATDPGTRRSTY